MKGKGCLLLIVALLIVGALQSIGGNQVKIAAPTAKPTLAVEFTSEPTAVPLQGGGRLTPTPTDWLTTTINEMLVTPEPTFFSPQTPSPTPAYIELKSGDSGEGVIALQERLVELGYPVGKADGNYGSKTTNSIKAMQILAGLAVTGVADQDTQAVLWEFDAPTAQPKPTPTVKPTKAPTTGGEWDFDDEAEDDEADYIANKNTKKFHETWCSSVDQMKEKNKWYFTGSRETLIKKGYKPCKRCDP